MLVKNRAIRNVLVHPFFESQHPRAAGQNVIAIMMMMMLMMMMWSCNLLPSRESTTQAISLTPRCVADLQLQQEALEVLVYHLERGLLLPATQF